MKNILKFQLILSIIAIIALLIMFANRIFDFHVRSKTMLIIASTCFVIISLISFIGNKGKFSFFIFVGLIFCWFGDFIDNFLLTVIFFLFAHLCFISAFIFYGIDKNKCLKSILIILLPSAIITYWLYRYIPSFDLPFVIAYIIVISAMVVFAFGTKPFYWIIILSAILFYISDIFVARWRFVDTSDINAFFCYPLYYTSCLLFAFSGRKDIKIQP